MKKPDAVTTPEAEKTGKSAEKKARKRVEEIKSFYTHLAVFLVAHAMMVGIYLLAGGGHFWPLYSFFGWGIGLASHAATTFDMFGMYGKAWEERKVREIMLQQEHGLNADEVRELLKREMHEERRALPSAEEIERMRTRLENLEAIVTSRDWDELPSHSGPLRKESAAIDLQDDLEGDLQDSLEGDFRGDHKTDLTDDLDPDDPTARAARLARRVR